MCNIYFNMYFNNGEVTNIFADLWGVLVSFFLSVTTDELTGILKKLSLEKYQPIFEEQEVCLF